MNKYLRLLRYDWPLHFVLLLTNWLPDNTPLLALRGFLAHFFLGSCGKNLRLGRNIAFYNPSKIHLGEDIYIAYGCWLMAEDTIYVDDKAILGPYCVIVTSNHELIGGLFQKDITKKAPIRVGKGSWLGAHVTVIGGAEIGVGSLVAAGAVVPNQKFNGHILLGGVPARLIKLLQNDSTS